VTVYNNDTAYQMEENSTVFVQFNHAALVTAGKSLSNGADLILAYGPQELARFNGTAFNNDSVQIFFSIPKSIPAGSKDSNYSFYYGDAGAALASRNYNISQVFYYFGDDFNGNTLNSSGYWQESSGAYAGTVANGLFSMSIANGSSANIYAFNRTNGAFADTNATVVFRARNTTAGTMVQYLSGFCKTTDLPGCGGVAHPAYSFRGGTTGIYYGSDLAASLDYVPSGGSTFHTLDLRLEPTSSRQQYWRGLNQTNPGNSTVATGTWNPTFGNDGAGTPLGLEFDWIGVRKRTTINEATTLTAAEDTKPAVSITIYAPTNTTYYNGTTTPFIFSVNDSINGTSYPVWTHDNGVVTNIGQIANGTTSTYTFNTTNGPNNATVSAYTSGGGNGTTSTYFTWTNGLNITAYNASQGVSTYLNNVWVNVSDGTNSTVTTGATTPLSLETRNLTHGSVSIEVFKPGYASANISAAINSNSSAYYNYFVPLWRLQEFHLDSGNGTNVTSFSLTAYQSGLNSTYSTSNGTIQISLGSLPTGTVVFQVTATGYNSTNTSFSINSSSEINATLTTTAAGIIIYAYDETFTTTRIYFSFLSTNSSGSASDYNSNYFWNGTYTNTSLTRGLTTLTFNNSINGTYGSRSYITTIDSTTAAILNVYLLNYSLVTAVYENVCTITSAGTTIAGATVTFQKSISGSYVTVAQVTTGSDGCAALWTDSATLYQIVASATGYNTGTVTAYGKSTQYLVLTSSSVVLGWSSTYADDLDLVLSRLQPEQASLYTSPVVVNYTVYSYNGTLTSFGMYCEYNGTSIYNVNVTGSPSGGSTTSSIVTTNKTNPTYFFCYGYFTRSGYNNTYTNRTFYIYSANTTFSNASISQTVNNSINANFSTGTLTIAAIVLTAVGTAGLTGVSATVGSPLGAGVISVALITGFGFLGWLNPLLVLLYWVVALSFAYFNSRQF
jgi:hypothetical protein